MCKEKARKYLNKHYVDNTFSLNEEVKINPKIIEKAIDIAIREAKKEVFDELEKINHKDSYGCKDYRVYPKDLEELKKKLVFGKQKAKKIRRNEC